MKRIYLILVVIMFCLTGCLEDGASVPAGNSNYDVLATAQAAEATAIAGE